MKNKLLNEFQMRFNLDDNFINIVESLFDKLIVFGYISRGMKNKLIQRLNDNVDYLYFQKDDKHDYKSGFYDADKKTMYIQNKKDISAIYLRVIYAVTSSEVDKNTHNMGFSTTYMSPDSYKLMYRNFALNRAVIANLVCRLTGTALSNIGLVPSYKTYSHNFFGYDILADNDIYAFEGRILSQMCFSIGIDEELFYSYLFSKSPVDAMNNMFEKTKFIDKIGFLTLFDNTSRKYSNYCKLNYLSDLLNKNYAKRRKYALDEKVIKTLENVETKIHRRIKDVIKSLNKDTNRKENDINYELETSLSATLEALEMEILENTVKIQDILASNIITGISYLSPYIYANKLKQFSSLVIMPNKKLDDAIYNTIMFKLVPDHETATTNIIQKIRYCLISDILETEKLTKVSNKIAFYRVESDLSHDHTEIAIVTVNNLFASIIKISDLNKSIYTLKNNTTNIQTTNLNYILNSDTAGKYTDKIEQIFSYLKGYFVHFKKFSLGDIFLFNISNKEYILVNTNNSVFLFVLTITNTAYSLSPLDLSSGFSLFNLKKVKGSASNLPTLYKEKNKFLGVFGV